MNNVQIIDGSDDEGVVTWLADYLSPRLAMRETIVTIPGGESPFPILTKLSRLDLAFSKLTVWPGDDRIVPEHHSASNVGRIRQILGPMGATIVPLALGAQPPHFALTWLGLGDDGHIASLFPNTKPRPDDPVSVRRLTPDPLPADAPFDRLSLTMPALLDSEQLLFVVRGAFRRRIFMEAVERRSDLPVARLLAAASQPATCFILRERSAL